MPKKDMPLVRIMPLGDSITQADKYHNSYRRPLWHMLEREGYRVDFVGSLSTQYRGGPPRQDFDPDHEGHWGWRADEVLRSGDGEPLRRHTPDIVLMHLGTNDMIQGQSVQTTAKELRQIVDSLRAGNPRVTVLIARLIPTTEPGYNRRIDELNQQIFKLASEETIPVSRVIVVDQHEGFNAWHDTYDGIHPNPRGERKMARKWFDALRPLF